MEAIGAFLDEEWESLSTLFSFEDAELLSSNFFSNHGEIPPAFLAGGEINVGTGVDDGSFLPSDTLDHQTNFYCASQESSNSSEIESTAIFTSWGDHENHPAANGGNFLHDNITANTFESMDFFTMDSKNNSSIVPVFTDDVMEQVLQRRAPVMCNDGQLGNSGVIQPAEIADYCKEMQLKRKYGTQGIQEHDDKGCPNNYSSESPQKKRRVSKNALKNKRLNSQSKKGKKAIQVNNDDELNNVGGNGQSSSICSSEEEYDSNNNNNNNNNASQQELVNGGSTSESKGMALNAKAKAGKGQATDPQSLYARKRRERINERLKILQNLVPNGTKVDISTMLEEAVHYVKFLQLQIKLLSSDDMWMYAPIAYNGMDMGLYQKIVPNLWPRN